MTEFMIHTKETTDGARRKTLDAVEKTYGFVPNLLAGLVESPAAARAYLDLGKAVGDTSFTPTERHVAWFRR